MNPYRILGFLLIAIPSAFFLATQWIDHALIATIANWTGILWALGFAFLVYSVLPYAWLIGLSAILIYGLYYYITNFILPIG